MCGIIGLIQAREDSVPAVMQGLNFLEYRGYDSAGLAVVDTEGKISCIKQVGKTDFLRKRLEESPLAGPLALGHTRWATHGEPSELNAHPHLSGDGRIAVVHNGIIENYATLREWLEGCGHQFISQTDTEVIAHLIQQHYRGDLVHAVQESLNLVEGAYAIAVLCSDHPWQLVGARSGSPLVVGIGDNGGFSLASDEGALQHLASKVVHLPENSIVLLTPTEYKTVSLANQAVQAEVREISVRLHEIDKGGYPHFMLKEIYEQPDTLRNALRGRILEDAGTARLGGLDPVIENLDRIKKFVLVGCGSSWHAALIGEYMLENIAGIEVEVDYASELRYRRFTVDPNITAMMIVSQSGETADTLEVMRMAKQHGMLTLGMCNTPGSSVSRETDAGIHLRAGREIGVASTKTFTSQVITFSLLSLLLARRKGEMNEEHGQRFVQALKHLPGQVEKALESNDLMKRIVHENQEYTNVIFLGRGYNFPVALEGALKLKEIAYVHAEGYPAAEMKHGPIALIYSKMPSIVIGTQPEDVLYQKMLSNIEEIRSRKGRVCAIASREDKNLEALAEEVCYVPETYASLSPIVNVIPLQLLAYHAAVLRGCDVDRPRNLAKSVTVE
ncbi:MAG: glutamine--fructose-6-phosphate transaminase (isomerizing) [Candidatus Omnitrophica bacterium]|nr:glutamine--fructose-6-phosphate transaminase (isomerizing) [Candidatus Omnitrophota bacterium]